MFHIEVRQGSKKVSRLNLPERELMLSILRRWVRGEKIEIGEISWRPDEAQITVIEGPEVPIGGMTLGRGWPTAQREGRDVTAEVLGKAQRALAEDEAERVAGGAARGGEPGGENAAADLALLADSLGLELLRRLGEGEITLLAVWQLAGERHPSMSPSSTLEVASAAVTSLSQSGLVVLLGGGEEGSAVPLEELGSALADVASWSSGEPAAAFRLRRA